MHILLIVCALASTSLVFTMNTISPNRDEMDVIDEFFASERWGDSNENRQLNSTPFQQQRQPQQWQYHQQQQQQQQQQETLVGAERDVSQQGLLSQHFVWHPAQQQQVQQPIFTFGDGSSTANHSSELGVIGNQAPESPQPQVSSMTAAGCSPTPSRSQMRISARLLPAKKRMQKKIPQGKKVFQDKKKEKPVLREFETGKRIAAKLQPKIISKLTDALHAHMEEINSLRYEITKIMSENMEKRESQKVECIACSKMLNRRGIQQHCSRYVYCFLCGNFELIGRDSCKNLAFVKNLTSIPLI